MKYSIDGILLLDKALHITSNGALQRVKSLFQAKKAGHTGSLDPLATGMLPICFGEATKFSQYLLESDKHYLVSMKLGVKTSTGDEEGEILTTQPVPTFTLSYLENIFSRWIGEIEQVPPMFSAVKYQGKPLYQFARRGITIERKARKVTIHALQIKNFSEENHTIEFSVHCSKGTYIRALVEDIGDTLGCGAYVNGLRRTAVQPYHEEKMIPLSKLEDLFAAQGLDSLMNFILPIESSFKHLPAISLASSSLFYIQRGHAVRVLKSPSKGLVRIFSHDDQFIGIGEILEDGRLIPVRLRSAR